MRFSFQNLFLLHGRQQATMKRFVFLVLVSALLAGCAMGPVFSPDVPLQKRETTNSLDASQIKQMVQSRIDPDDFDYPFDDWLTLDVRGTMLFVNGVINSYSYEEIYYILRENPQVNTLVLTNIPGSMDDETNLALGLELHRANVTMYLPKDAEIASGGTDLFLAGTRRIVERGALIGVHSWSAGLPFFGTAADELPRDHPDHELFLDYYRDIDISEDFYWYTLEAASPDDIHWMTEDEMERYDVFTTLVD